MSDSRSELTDSFDALGRAATTLAGKLLGPKAIGKETVSDIPAISPETDAALVQAGETLGRFLHATGEALKAHPLDPLEAARDAQAHAGSPVTAEEGWSPLAEGFRNLGSGLEHVAEGMLDKVAPRKPKAPPSDE